MTWVAQSILHELAGEPGQPLALADLGARLAHSPKSISHACGILYRRELIERPEPGWYRLAAAGQALLDAGRTIRTGPAQGRAARVSATTLRHRVWNALGQRRKTTVPELLRLTSRGHERQAASNIYRYLRLLELTGYLLRNKTRRPGSASTSNGYLQWVVLRWTGPRAPSGNLRRRTVYDPNLCVTHRLDRSSEEDAHD